VLLMLCISTLILDFMSLDPTPCCPLTDCEIARVISAVIGGLAIDCSDDAIFSALRFIVQNESTYKKTLAFARQMAKGAKEL